MKKISFILSTILIAIMAFGLRAQADSTDFYINNPNISHSQQGQTLRFVQLTDVHIFSEGDVKQTPLETNTAKLQDAVNQVNQMKDIDFVIFSGDNIHRRRMKDLRIFAQIASNLKFPWYVGLGNHDVGINTEVTKDKFYDTIKSYNINQTNTLPYYSFSPKTGYFVVVMDGVIDSKFMGYGYYTKEELNWLDSQLKTHLTSKVIIVQHFPLITSVDDIKDGNSSDIVNCKEYLNLLAKYNNIIMIASGHIHTNRLTQAGNVLHVSTSAVFKRKFSLITISDKDNIIKINVKHLRTNPPIQ